MEGPVSSVAPSIYVLDGLVGFVGGIPDVLRGPSCGRGHQAGDLHHVVGPCGELLGLPDVPPRDVHFHRKCF